MLVITYVVLGNWTSVTGGQNSLMGLPLYVGLWTAAGWAVGGHRHRLRLSGEPLGAAAPGLARGRGGGRGVRRAHGPHRLIAFVISAFLSGIAGVLLGAFPRHGAGRDVLSRSHIPDRGDAGDRRHAQPDRRGRRRARHPAADRAAAAGGGRRHLAARRRSPRPPGSAMRCWRSSCSSSSSSGRTASPAAGRSRPFRPSTRKSATETHSQPRPRNDRYPPRRHPRSTRPRCPRSPRTSMSSATVACRWCPISASCSGHEAALVIDTGMGPANGRGAGNGETPRRRPATDPDPHPFPPRARFWRPGIQGPGENRLQHGPARRIGGKGEGLSRHVSRLRTGVAAALEETEIVVPDEVYDGDEKMIDLGGRSVELSTCGLAHTRGDQVVSVPDASSCSSAICRGADLSDLPVVSAQRRGHRRRQLGACASDARAASRKSSFPATVRSAAWRSFRRARLHRRPRARVAAIEGRRQRR